MHCTHTHPHSLDYYNLQDENIYISEKEKSKAGATGTENELSVAKVFSHKLIQFLIAYGMLLLSSLNHCYHRCRRLHLVLLPVSQRRPITKPPLIYRCSLLLMLPSPLRVRCALTHSHSVSTFLLLNSSISFARIHTHIQIFVYYNYKSTISMELIPRINNSRFELNIKQKMNFRDNGGTIAHIHSSCICWRE